jgi:hypothetical protein
MGIVLILVLAGIAFALRSTPGRGFTLLTGLLAGIAAVILFVVLMSQPSPDLSLALIVAAGALVIGGYLAASRQRQDHQGDAPAIAKNAVASILLGVLIAIGILVALIICALEFGPDPFTF